MLCGRACSSSDFALVFKSIMSNVKPATAVAYFTISCFLGSTKNQRRHPINNTAATTITGIVKLCVISANFPKVNYRKKPPICPPKFMTPAAAPA